MMFVFYHRRPSPNLYLQTNFHTLQTVVSNTPDHPRNPSLEVKLDALHRCFELGESIKSVSEEIGYTRASIYAWRKKYLQGGAVSLMNDKNIQPGTLKEGTPHTPQNQEIEQLRAQLQDMQLEIDFIPPFSCFERSASLTSDSPPPQKSAIKKTGQHTVPVEMLSRSAWFFFL